MFRSGGMRAAALPGGAAGLGGDGGRGGGAGVQGGRPGGPGAVDQGRTHPR